MTDDPRVEAALAATGDITPWRTNRRRLIEVALAAADAADPRAPTWDFERCMTCGDLVARVEEPPA